MEKRVTKHKIIEIKKIIDENDCIKTFILSDGLTEYKPGQFLMVWLPGVDEKPFVFSDTDPYSITVEKKGTFTQKLFELKVGDKLGLRGPRGNGFKIEKGKKAICVAGGLGYAPLSNLIKQLKNPTIITGCKTEDLRIFKGRFKELKPLVCTDDGTCGIKGFTTELLEEELKNNRYDIVYTCGPEVMMQKVFEICEKYKIECQASLERYMFCGGMGLCGSCAIGPYLVCKDGPVFNSEQLRQIPDFGKFAKLKSGRTVPLNEFFEWRNK